MSSILLREPVVAHQAHPLDIVKINQPFFMAQFPLRADNYLIREITLNDFTAFHEIAATPGFVYYCFDGTPEKTNAFVHEAIEGRKSGQTGLRKSYMMAVEEIGGARNLVGHVAVDLLDKEPDHYDLGYFTHPAHQGRGIARKASVALLKTMFDFLGINKIVATVHPTNVPSQRVLAKLGFQETGENALVESANGDNIRNKLVLTRSAFKQKLGL